MFCCNSALSVANVEFLSHWIDKVIQTVWTDCSVQNMLGSTLALQLMQPFFSEKKKTWSEKLLYVVSSLQSIDPFTEENDSSPKHTNTPTLTPGPVYLSSLTPTSLSVSLSIFSPPPLLLLHLPFPRNQQAQPPLRLQKPASLSASATLLLRLVLHASNQSTCFIGHIYTCRQACTCTHGWCAEHFIHCYL